MLWTIYPMQSVMNQEDGIPQRSEVSHAGRLFIVSETGDGVNRIERMISTDPADYLIPRWQPGRTLPPGQKT